MAARETPRCPPLVKHHAEDRWETRAQHDDDLELDPWTAWVDALPLELPSPFCELGDEARYHPDSAVILCRRDAAITTVYDVFGPDGHPDVRDAVANQLGIEMETSR